MKNARVSGLLVLFFLTPLLHGQEFEIRTVADKHDIPEKLYTLGEKGDYFITDGRYVILIGGTSRTLYSILNYPAADAMGSIIGFAPAAKNSAGDTIVGSPSLRIDEKRKDINYTWVTPEPDRDADGALVVRAGAAYEGERGEKARIATTYRIVPQSGTIEVLSTLENTGQKTIENLQYSVYFSARHVYSFSPFSRDRHPESNFRIYPKEGHFLGWIDRNPQTFSENPGPGTLEPGQSYDVKYILMTRSDGGRLLEDIYEVLGIVTEPAVINFEEQERDLTEVIVREVLTGSVFYRNFLDKPFTLEIRLPPGIYSVTAHFFPAVVEELLLVESGSENECVLRDPPHGIVKVKIKDSEEDSVPGKVTFIGLDPTKSPYFTPENPVKSGKNWETFKNSCYPGEGGLEVRLPAGTYLAYASRGPEYTLESKILEIYQDNLENLTFHIDKVVRTDNLISVDPHMHTIYSDGRVSIAERIKSVVAEGVEVAVATDHNFVNDYRPALRKLGLNVYLAAIPGNEVTTGGVIHFNTYPLLYRKDEERNGAIYPHRETAAPLFRASREKDPEALLQVNHPRSGTIGYFNNCDLDADMASSANRDLDLGFDLLEVLNGPYFYSSNEQSVKDWFNLINRGYYFPLVGSSDSHTIEGGQPGYSRTYVYYDGRKGDNLDILSLIQAIKKGHSFATNGPVVDFKIDGTHIPGDTLTAREGKVDIRLEVQSAPWISVSEVRLVIDGKRAVLFPVDSQENSVLKFSAALSLPLEKDCSIAAEVMGNKSLFPVHQARARNGRQKNATLSYALTNPIFIDVDGNGTFDPPLSGTIHLKESSETEAKPVSGGQN
jgi:hypothetical protein